MKKYILTIALVGIALLGTGAYFLAVSTDNKEQAPTTRERQTKSIAQNQWIDAELTDVRTGEKFHLSDFAGKTILLESFAVWCPTCLKQQQEIKQLQGLSEEDVVHVSLDTDPNESGQAVRDHAQRHDFNWLFAISPPQVTQQLIDEFGLDFVNAPAAPVVIIGPDQEAFLLPRGVKKAAELQTEIEKLIRK